MEGDVSLERTCMKGGLPRLVHQSHSHGDSRGGWIDLRTGEALYSGSWAMPQNMRPRGNVTDDDYGISAFGEYGGLSASYRRVPSGVAT
jgi:hypothetical protein